MCTEEVLLRNEIKRVEAQVTRDVLVLQVAFAVGSGEGRVDAIPAASD